MGDGATQFPGCLDPFLDDDLNAGEGFLVGFSIAQSQWIQSFDSKVRSAAMFALAAELSIPSASLGRVLTLPGWNTTIKLDMG